MKKARLWVSSLIYVLAVGLFVVAAAWVAEGSTEPFSSMHRFITLFTFLIYMLIVMLILEACELRETIVDAVMEDW